MNLRTGHLARAALVMVALEAVVACGLAIAGSAHRERLNDVRRVNRRLVSELGLTDLALWSDASYCRHPISADFFSAHSDHPAAMDHFPAGSIAPPPPWFEAGVRESAP
jgi:hypothetical protein